MAMLRDKMWDLIQQMDRNLKPAIVKAEVSEQYPDYHAAFEQLRMTENLIKAVRSHLRAKMRKAKPLFQDNCPHSSKADTHVRHVGGVRVVERQTCNQCTKTFELEGKKV